MSKLKWARPLLVAGLGLALSGCAFQRGLEGVAVNHNEMVADAANQVTLLNILRARGREPLQFTSISRLTGSATAAGKATGNVAAKGPTPTVVTDAAGKLVSTSTLAGTDVVTPGLEASVTAASSFDIGVFDTQEFYQGIITSIPPGIIAHYLHQGWPGPLLEMLFVSSVDIVATGDATLKDGRVVKKGQVVRAIRNEAWGGTPSDKMQAFMSCYALVSYTRETPDRKLVQVKDLKLDVAGLGVLDGDKYDVEEPSAGDPAERWVSRKGRTSDALMIVLRDLAKKAECDKVLTDLVPDEADLNIQVDLGQTRGGYDEPARVGLLSARPKSAGGTAKPAAYAIQLTIRSVDGVIYYLGECLRTHEACEPVDVGTGDRLKIFTLSRQKPKTVFTSAEFHGQRYYVPAGEDDGGRSSQVIDLIQQLVNLQKSSKDRPATATVRVVQ